MRVCDRWQKHENTHRKAMDNLWPCLDASQSERRWRPPRF
jgi:hypothetical protein